MDASEELHHLASELANAKVDIDRLSTEQLQRLAVLSQFMSEQCFRALARRGVVPERIPIRRDH